MARPRLEPDTSRDHELARIEIETGMPFEILAERFDRGLRGDDLTRTERPGPTATWLTTEQAEDILCVGRNYLAYRSEEFACLRRCIRSSRGAKNPRGAGWLWYREDVETVHKIAQRCQLRPLEAVRVFAALNEDRIP